MSSDSRARHWLVTRRVTVALGAACLLLAGLIVPAAVTTAQAGPSVQPRNGAYPATTDAVIRLISVGTAPIGVAVDQGDDTVYVVNFIRAGSLVPGSVSVINGRSGTVSSTISVGFTPISVAVNQDDDTVYVTNQGDNYVSIINGRTATSAGTITVANGGWGVAVDQSDDSLYATTNISDDSVWVINGRSATVTTSIAVGDDPTSIAVNHVDDSVYVARLNAGTLSVINGRTAAAAGTIAVGGGPIGVAVNQDDDTVYVTNSLSNNVSVINGRTGAASGTISVGTAPRSVAVDQSDDTVYVTNSGSNNVSIINGRNATVAGTVTVGGGPRGVAVDDVGTNQGLVYVSNYDDSTVSVIGRVTPSLVTASGYAGDPVMINLDVPQVAYDVDDSSVASVTFGGTTLTPTPLAGDSWRVIAPAGAAGSSVAVTVTFRGGLTASAGTFTYATPPPPPPPPVFPPSAPLNLAAVGGDAQATLTWAAPADSGSFPVTNYEVRSTPAGKSCIVTTLTCTITGLTNGTAYSFETRALNGAGWGAWSTPSNTVIPIAPVLRSITITGSRGTGADRKTITVAGRSTGLTDPQVRAHVKLRGQTDYRPGRFVNVATDGTFTWQRTTGRKAYIYFSGDGIQSNRIIIPAITG